MATTTVSVYGKPITLGNRTERAKAAAKYRNADGKLDQVMQDTVQFEKDVAGDVNMAGGNFNRSFGVNSTDVDSTSFSNFDHTGFNSARGHFNFNDSPQFSVGRSLGQVGHHTRQRMGRAPTTQGIPRTSCCIYNATGDPITFVLEHDWQGHAAGRCPKIIQNGQWAVLKHVGTREPNAKGSIAAVVYNIQDYADAMFCWSNPIKTPAFQKNTVYCQMNDPGYFNNDVDWNEMYHNVRDSGSQYEAEMEGFTLNVRIEPKGSTPRFWAEFNLDT